MNNRLSRRLGREARPFAAFLALATTACSNPAGPSIGPIDFSVPIEGSSTLAYRDGGRLDSQRSRIETVVKETLAAVRLRLPVERVTIVVQANAPGTIPEIGIGGRADEDTVRLSFDPDSPRLPESLETELFPLLAHELHHVARFSAGRYNSNLLAALITEGLADQFSVELARADPPLWASALPPEQLTRWSARARDEWFDSSYNHDAWFLGATPDIPRWAGYSIGFDLVERFLMAHPTRRPSDLFNEPAASFTATAGPR